MGVSTLHEDPSALRSGLCRDGRGFAAGLGARHQPIGESHEQYQQHQREPAEFAVHALSQCFVHGRKPRLVASRQSLSRTRTDRNYELRICICPADMLRAAIESAMAPTNLVKLVVNTMVVKLIV
jgi:hypothetical protein